MMHCYAIFQSFPNRINGKIMRVTILSRTIEESGRQEYFFSKDHCQKTVKGFVPTTFHLPMSVVPREGLWSGRVETREDIIKVFYRDDIEIPNPDSSLQD